jgi:hypothetical protein
MSFQREREVSLSALPRRAFFGHAGRGPAAKRPVFLIVGSWSAGDATGDGV